jgi:hypothetical protein
MKKLIAILALSLTATSAFADGHWGGHGGYYGGHHGGGGYYNHSHYDFVGPAILGGIVGYAIAQPRYVQPAPTVIYQQPQVIYQQPQYQQNCTAWVETIDQYGNVTRTRTCY